MCRQRRTHSPVAPESRQVVRREAPVVDDFGLELDAKRGSVPLDEPMRSVHDIVRENEDGTRLASCSYAFGANGAHRQRGGLAPREGPEPPAANRQLSVGLRDTAQSGERTDVARNIEWRTTEDGGRDTIGRNGLHRRRRCRHARSAFVESCGHNRLEGIAMKQLNRVDPPPLPDSIDAADPLLESQWIPRQLEVHD